MDYGTGTNLRKYQWDLIHSHQWWWAGGGFGEGSFYCEDLLTGVEWVEKVPCDDCYLLSPAGQPFKFSSIKKVAILIDKAVLDGGKSNPADFLLSAIYSFETNTTIYHPSIPNGHFEGYYQAGIAD